MYKNIPEILLDKVKYFKNKKIIYHKEKSLSYEQIINYSLNFSKFLNQFNLKDGDNISICMNKNFNQIIAITACLFSNFTFVPILPKLNKDTITHIIKDSKSKLVITDKFRYAEIDKNFFKNILIFDDSIFRKISRIELLKIKKNFLKTIKKDDNAAIIYSSGSTGMPKGIIIPHKNLVKGAFIVSDYLGTKHSDKILGILSFNFDYGLNQLWQCYLKGSSLHLFDYIFAKDLLHFIQKEKITVLPLMPVIMTLAFQETIRKKFNNIRYICTSGGPVEKKLIVKLKKIFPKAKIYLMYGLTEAFRSTFLEPKKALIKYDSIGQSIPSVKIHILNSKLEDCKVGEIGELVHRGGCISKGYFNDKIKTNKIFKKIKRFPKEVVVFSGDLVRKDKDGDIYFVGRKDSLIKTAGYRVSPTEIEKIIQKIPQIKFAVACGVYDSVKGQKIICAYTSYNKKKISKNLLSNHSRNLFPSYMKPEKYIFFKNFPVTGNQGKINRTQIIKKIKKNDYNIKKKDPLFN